MAKNTDNRDVREIEDIIFGVYSPEEIRKLSVCKIDSSKLCSSDKNTGYGTVYDPRMGTIENGKICETCNGNAWTCSSHWGYIDLNEPVVHPLHYKRVVDFLRCFCMKCFKLLITEDQILLNNLGRTMGVKRFNKILEKLEKIDICTHCSRPQPDIKYITSDGSISMVYKQKDKNKISIVLPVEEIKNIFDNISIEDVKLLGFNPELMQPRNLILTVFPVIPVACRPYIVSESNICDDDLTIQLVEIIKANNHLKIEDGVPISETKRQKYIQSLKFRIATFYNNSCLAPDTPVLMWDGSIKRADQVDIDDELVGDDGEKRIVEITCSGEDEMYEITQEKGDSYIVNSNHYLTLKYPEHNKIAWLNPTTDSPFGSWHMCWFDSSTYSIENKTFSVTETVNKDETLKLITEFKNSIIDEDVFDIRVKDYLKLSKSVTECLVGLKLAKSVNWMKKDVLIDPYILGTYLGKGNFSLWKDLVEKYGLDTNNIPNEFLYNDENTRSLLLAGILAVADCAQNSEICISYSIKREKFAKQVCFLAKTLGLNSSVETGSSQLEVYISGYGVEKIPSKSVIKNCITSAIQVKSIGKGKYNGFIIDKNHRFLLGDFTITHNSGKAKHSTNGRSIKGLKERLTSKDGLIRSNLMGKRCFFMGTKMILWNGEIKNVEDIKIGDVLIGNDGKQRKVLDLHNGIDQLYRIKQKKGEEYVVNSEHILTFKYSNLRTISWRNTIDSWFVRWFNKSTMKMQMKKLKETKTRTKEDAYNELKNFVDKLEDDNTINISVKEYLKLPEKTKKLLFGYKIEKPVEWDYKEVDIDPYILGMWLGDGYQHGKQFTSVDKELVDCWKKWGSSNGITINLHNDGRNMQYGITGIKNGKSIFRNKLSKYGLLDSKFIPKDFIYNSKEVRLSVLAGLIDTDGSVEQEGTTIRISQCYEHEQILQDTKFLADSLGFQTSLKNKKTSWTHKGEKKHGNALVLSISGKGIENIPTLLERKKCNPPRVLDTTWTQIEVEPGEVGEYTGVEIDCNNLFVLPDFTVVHNCEQSGRTVIGPDPTLKMGQLAVPPEMANNLTVPVQVTNYNFEMLTNIVNDGKANFVIKKDSGVRINLDHKLFFRGTILEHGDIIIRTDPETGEEKELVVNNGKDMVQPGDRLKRNGEYITDIKYPEKRKYKLDIGDVVERKLQDGDVVLLNRQPTLHEGSMMAQEIVVRKGKTLRFNLSIAKSFNADFDGDEMNIHVPQTVESQTELKLLSASKYKMISAQGSRPNFCIVQDSLLGAYRMTRGNQPVRKDQFYDISMKLDISIDKILKKIQHIRKVLKEKGKKVQCFNGKGLISLALPDDLFYERKNNADPDEPTLRIYKGVLYEGTLDKSVLGATQNSLIHVINKEYGCDVAAFFIDCVQFITNSWLLLTGFSVGIEDCMVQGVEQKQRIKDVIQKCYIEAEGIKTTTSHAGIREVRITGTLSKAKDIGLKISKDSLSECNNFLSTVNSGSKGDHFNIAQVTGLLGQQNLLGKRVNPTLNNGTRTLPHYPMSDLDLNNEYESRGFIESSFIKGLNPKQFYFHSMSGREGCADTAMNTATSGYIQRRIVKLTEDIKVNYDNTIRDTIGSIYQVAYGEDGINPTTTIKVDKNQEICDISSIVNKLNIKEDDLNNKKSKKS